MTITWTPKCVVCGFEAKPRDVDLDEPICLALSCPRCLAGYDTSELRDQIYRLLHPELFTDQPKEAP